MLTLKDNGTINNHQQITVFDDLMTKSKGLCEELKLPRSGNTIQPRI
jgi:hypothetical protein